ncbi:hypothetical protein [Nocardia sp. NPDC052566]|uniref:hypothetical protein n=1 Tax=Nocardia sp. NPDC052566 TaxID=3364330 RepID=UPI0037C96EF4
MAMFAKRSLAASALATATLTTLLAFGDEPEARAVAPTRAQADGYVLGDTVDCFVDYRAWVEHDSAQPDRLVAYVQPLGVRPTIPGLPSPGRCATSLTAQWSDGVTVWPPHQASVRIDAGPTPGTPQQLILPIAPEAQSATVIFVNPMLSLPLVPGATAMLTVDLRH